MESLTPSLDKNLHLMEPKTQPEPESGPSEEALAFCAPTTQTPLTATCHCGNISVTVPGKPQYINECQCSVCYRYGAAWAYYLRRDVKVQKKEGAGTKVYIWGDGEVAFHACDHCFGMMYWWPVDKTSNDPQRKYTWNMGLNSNMIHWEQWDRVERRKTFMQY